nr:uncharacterized protein LOC124805924 [Hydra vulgaris]
MHRIYTAAHKQFQIKQMSFASPIVMILVLNIFLVEAAKVLRKDGSQNIKSTCTYFCPICCIPKPDSIKDLKTDSLPTWLILLKSFQTPKGALQLWESHSNKLETHKKIEKLLNELFDNF